MPTDLRDAEEMGDNFFEFSCAKYNGKDNVVG